MPYIVDQTVFVFHAEGAVISWTAAAQRLNIPVWAPLPTVIELRWMLSADLGMPTEPFAVLARQHTAGSTWQPLTDLAAAAPVPRTRRARDLVARQRLERELDVQAPSGGWIFAFAGGPLLSNICEVATVATGNTTVELAAHIIDGLLVAPGITVTAVRGLFTSAYANAPGWTEIELVGLPVKRADWSGIG